MSAILFPTWLIVGMLIYVFYGYRKNRRKERLMEEMQERALEKKQEETVANEV